MGHFFDSLSKRARSKDLRELARNVKDSRGKWNYAKYAGHEPEFVVKSKSHMTERLIEADYDIRSKDYARAYRAVSEVAEKIDTYAGKDRDKYYELAESRLARIANLASGEIATAAAELGKTLSGRKKQSSLENISVIIGLAGILVALLFLSPNLTGNAISNVSQTVSNKIGAMSFVIGLIGIIFYFIKG